MTQSNHTAYSEQSMDKIGSHISNVSAKTISRFLSGELQFSMRSTRHGDKVASIETDDPETPMPDEQEMKALQNALEPVVMTLATVVNENSITTSHGAYQFGSCVINAAKQFGNHPSSQSYSSKTLLEMIDIEGVTQSEARNAVVFATIFDKQPMDDEFDISGVAELARELTNSKRVREYVTKVREATGHPPTKEAVETWRQTTQADVKSLVDVLMDKPTTDIIRDVKQARVLHDNRPVAKDTIREVAPEVSPLTDTESGKTKPNGEADEVNDNVLRFQSRPESHQSSDSKGVDKAESDESAADDSTVELNRGGPLPENLGIAADEYLNSGVRTITSVDDIETNQSPAALLSECQKEFDIINDYYQDESVAALHIAHLMSLYSERGLRLGQLASIDGFDYSQPYVSFYTSVGEELGIGPHPRDTMAVTKINELRKAVKTLDKTTLDAALWRAQGITETIKTKLIKSLKSVEETDDSVSEYIQAYTNTTDTEPTTTEIQIMCAVLGREIPTKERVQAAAPANTSIKMSDTSVKLPNQFLHNPVQVVKTAVSDGEKHGEEPITEHPPTKNVADIIDESDTPAIEYIKRSDSLEIERKNDEAGVINCSSTQDREMFESVFGPVICPDKLIETYSEETAVVLGEQGLQYWVDRLTSAGITVTEVSLTIETPTLDTTAVTGCDEEDTHIKGYDSSTNENITATATQAFTNANNHMSLSAYDIRELSKHPLIVVCPLGNTAPKQYAMAIEQYFNYGGETLYLITDGVGGSLPIAVAKATTQYAALSEVLLSITFADDTTSIHKYTSCEK